MQPLINMITDHNQFWITQGDSNMTYQKDYTTTYTINGREYEITAPALFCSDTSDTDEIISDVELDDQAAEIARQKYRDDMGLIGPDELKAYRKKTGLTQQELADLVGISHNVITLYKAGAFPTQENNRRLKAVMGNF